MSDNVIPLPVPPPPERMAAIWAASDVLWAQREAEREAEAKTVFASPRLRVVR